jgi:ABC-type transporter Mla subunit MlaD
MTLLTWITIVYFVVLVLVLAVGLIAILKTLMSVAEKLGKISGGLQQVEKNTAPLNAGVEKLNGSLGSLAGGLMVAESSFASADQHLQETLDAVTVSK